MLVLSRRPEQEICFPTLDIRIRVLKAAGSVKLGVDAPSAVPICRGELEQSFSDFLPSEQEIDRLPKAVRHEIRNRLNSLSLGLYMLQYQLEHGRRTEAEETIELMLNQLEAVQSHRLLVPSDSETPDEADHFNALLVEDEPNERELLAGLLRLNDIDVQSVGSGEAAIDYLEGASPPDVVLLDLNLPGCSGETILKWIRSRDRFDNVRVYIVSGSDPAKSDDRRVNSADRWFRKPLNPQSLLQAMKT